MSNKTSVCSLQDILEGWDVTGEEVSFGLVWINLQLLNKLKNAFDHQYIIKRKEEGSQLFKEIEKVLQNIQVSYKDDLNHRIRKQKQDGCT